MDVCICNEVGNTQMTRHVGVPSWGQRHRTEDYIGIIDR